MEAIAPIHEPLTDQENAVLKLLAEGLSNHEIGERMFLAPSTVKWYVRQLNAKLDTRNRKQIIERASSLGLLQQEQSPEKQHNLPAMTTPFIGRLEALRDVRLLLSDQNTRLITIQGPGGMGKTRLAIEVAHSQLDKYRDGVYFVDLAPMSQSLEQMREWVLADFVLKLRNGHPLLDCAQDVAESAEEPIADSFRRFLHSVERGVPLSNALDALFVQTQDTEYGAIIEIIRTQADNPERLSERLDRWRTEHSERLRRLTRSETAEDARSLIANICAVVQGYAYGSAQNDQSLKQYMFDAFANQHLLLVLDNFEYLLRSAPLIVELLYHAPNIRVIVTSREKLNLAGEPVYPLTSMNIADWPSLEEANEADSVQLFVQAARRTNPNLAVADKDLPHLHCICYLTGGMPLGLLLAASWADVLTLREIAEEIQRSVEFLQTDQGDVIDRHRSMRAVFNTTWQRLSAEEQDVFMRLAIFRDGCTREAAEKIAGANLRSLKRLVNHSLIYVSGDGRYRVHELLRQFGEQRLVEAGLYDVVGIEHARYFTELAELAEPELRRRDQEMWFACLDADCDNFRVALQYTVDRSELDLALRLIGATRDSWYYNGPHADGVYWASLILSITTDRKDSLRAKALIAGGLLHYAMRQVPQALEYLTEAIAICEREDLLRLLGWATMYYGEVLSYNGESQEGFYWLEDETMATVIEHCERGLAILRQVGDTAGIVQALNVLGNRYIRSERWHTHGKPLYEECLAYCKHTGERRRELIIYGNMAQIAYMHGDHDRAIDATYECLRRSAHLKFDYFVAITLLNVTGSLAAKGRAYAAAQIYGAVKRFEHRFSISHTPGQQAIFDHMLMEVHDLLEDDAFQEAYEQGQSMSLDAAVQFALDIDIPDRPKIM